MPSYACRVPRVSDLLETRNSQLGTIYNADMRKRALWLVIAGVVLGAAAVITLLWTRSAAPEPVRLLPAADAYVYLDLKPLRAAGVQLPAVSLEADYQQFVRETGFQFERDLDEAAFAVHLAPTVQLNASQPQETRYSEVFIARFDPARLTAYLRKLASAVEKYRGLDVYAIALPGRTLRVAIIGPKMVAASNVDGPYVLQGIIDRVRELAPASGPELVRRYYRDLPLASLAWAITETTPGPQGNSVFVLPGGYQVFFPAGTGVVAALRYVGVVQFTAEAFTANNEQAQRVSDQLSAFVAIFRTLEGAHAGNDPDMKAFLEGIHVEQKGARVELSATIPKGFVKKLVAETPGIPAVTAPEPEKKKPNLETRKHRGKKKRR